MMPQTRKRSPLLICFVALLTYMHYSQSCSFEEADDHGSALASHCGVLITSQGGVGSSTFMELVERIDDHHPGAVAPLTINFHDNKDGFKHRPASYWKNHDKHALVGTLELNSGGENGYRAATVCFQKVLVIIGDPIHTIESTYRRFSTSHINNLRRGSGREEYAMYTELATIYKDIAQSGNDEVGISHYISSWWGAQKDREHWPEIRIVTPKTLFNNAQEVAMWIGVKGEELKPFDGLSYQESEEHHMVKVKGVDDATIEKVTRVYQSVYDIVKAVDNGSEWGRLVPEEPSRREI